MIGEAIQLDLANPLQFMGNIEPQLAQELGAVVGDELRGVETAPEHPPAIAAQFRHQEGVRAYCP